MCELRHRFLLTMHRKDHSRRIKRYQTRTFDLFYVHSSSWIIDHGSIWFDRWWKMCFYACWFLSREYRTWHFSYLWVLQLHGLRVMFLPRPKDQHFQAWEPFSSFDRLLLKWRSKLVLWRKNEKMYKEKPSHAFSTFYEMWKMRLRHMFSLL